MRRLARFALMIFAYAAAISAETAAFLVVIYLTASDLLIAAELLSSTRAWSDIFHPLVITLIWVSWALFTLLPVIVAVTFAELCEVQSARYFLIWGLIGAAGVWFVFEVMPQFENPRPMGMFFRDTGAFAAAGLAFGFVYWVIAGRTAGDWMETRGTRETKA